MGTAITKVTYTSVLPQWAAGLSKETNVRLVRAYSEVQGSLLQSLTGTKSGLVYRVPGTQTLYTASAPGQTPARRLGDLARSYSQPPSLRDVYRGQIAFGSKLNLTRKPYPAYLENGSPKTGLEPRPHLTPAFENTRKRVIEILSGEFIIRTG